MGILEVSLVENAVKGKRTCSVSSVTGGMKRGITWETGKCIPEGNCKLDTFLRIGSQSETRHKSKGPTHGHNSVVLTGHPERR